jgi:hypothetical protein
MGGDNPALFYLEGFNCFPPQILESCVVLRYPIYLLNGFDLKEFHYALSRRITVSPAATLPLLTTVPNLPWRLTI